RCECRLRSGAADSRKKCEKRQGSDQYALQQQAASISRLRALTIRLLRRPRIRTGKTLSPAQATTTPLPTLSPILAGRTNRQSFCGLPEVYVRGRGGIARRSPTCSTRLYCVPFAHVQPRRVRARSLDGSPRRSKENLQIGTFSGRKGWVASNRMQ